MGDVAAHGLQAAIVVGEVRQAVRTASLTANSPADVLERANAMVNLRAEPVMVTTIFGILDPPTSTVTYAVAGHPAPVLVMPDFRAELLPSGGLPLGVADAVGSADWTFTLAPGSLLALYTDGLTEYRHDVLEGETQLMRALERELADGAPSARSLLGRIFAFAENTDDAAALILAAAPDVPARDFYFEFSAIPFAVPMVRHALRRYAHRMRLDEDRTFALITAVGEAMANAVEHAYDGPAGNVRVRVVHDGGVFVATIEDFGRWKPAEKHEERGRGLPLMRALADAVEIRTDHQRTTLSLRWGQTPAR
jgi:anti-sigma regulatory factor (Ser/Thr protein kinase)